MQNYTPSQIDENGSLPVPEGAVEIAQMDYEFYPEGLEHVIRKVTEGRNIPAFRHFSCSCRFRTTSEQASSPQYRKQPSQ